MKNKKIYYLEMILTSTLISIQLVSNFFKNGDISRIFISYERSHTKQDIILSIDLKYEYIYISQDLNCGNSEQNSCFLCNFWPKIHKKTSKINFYINFFYGFLFNIHSYSFLSNLAIRKIKIVWI